MSRVVFLIAVAACGRISFDPRVDAGSVPIGHDGEPYRVQSSDGFYSGGDGIDVNTNNLHLHIRYACVITSS